MEKFTERKSKSRAKKKEATGLSGPEVRDPTQTDKFQSYFDEEKETKFLKRQFYRHAMKDSEKDVIIPDLSDFEMATAEI